MLLQIVYSSEASRVMSITDLDKILDTARTQNDANGVSGILLFGDGQFIQVLEGESEAVEETMNRVAGDTRHKNVTILLKRPVEGRTFGGWRMGFMSDGNCITRAQDELTKIRSVDEVVGESNGDYVIDLIHKFTTEHSDINGTLVFEQK